MGNYNSSEDVLREINNITDSMAEGGNEPEEETFSSLSQEYDDGLSDDDRELADYLENDNNLKQQWRASEMERMKSEFARTGVVPQSMDFDTWKVHREIVEPQQNLQSALSEDLESLAERYPRAINHFIRKMRRGEVSMPEGIEAEPNALEQMLIQSITPEEARKMDTDTLAEIIGYAEYPDERRPPLRTRSLDAAIPARKKPVQQKVKRQPTYTLPDVTQEDFQEMFSDWMRKRPEKMGRGR